MGVPTSWDGFNLVQPMDVILYVILTASNSLGYFQVYLISGVKNITDAILNALISNRFRK